ncbi:MAG: hypothetical protein AB7H71_13535 [Alphaproteobacteria bacterium]
MAEPGIHEHLLSKGFKGLFLDSRVRRVGRPELTSLQFKLTATERVLHPI